MNTRIFANRKLQIALGCYVVLAVIGALTLEGMLLGAVLCLFAILTVKTLIHALSDEDSP